MNDILFTHSYFLRFDPKQWKTMQPYPPLATLYAAAMMRDKGYTVSLYDTMFSASTQEVQTLVANAKPSFFVIYDDGFNYLTKMCLTNMREAAFEMIRHAKESGAKVIVSSSDASDHYEKYLVEGADYCILGEAEETLFELVQTLSGKTVTPIESIKGLAYKKEEKIISTGRKEVMKDLDQLPMPAWDLVDMEAYKSRWIKKNGYFSLNLVTTRGCPYKCNWCAKPIYGNRYNSHEAARTIREIEHLKKHYQPDHIWFCDDIFGLKPGWLKAFRDGIVENKFSIRYKIQSRVDLLVEKSTVQLLAESGCETVWLGAESGSQKILDAMDKGISLAQIKQARKYLKEAGIRCAFFLQFGYLGETKKDEEATIDMVLELMPEEIGVSVSYPLPGTKFYEKVKNELSHKKNWEDSDDLSMMFRDSVHPKYYKQLQRFIHKAFQEKKGSNSLNQWMNKPFSVSAKEIKEIAGLAYYKPMRIIEGLKLKKLSNG